MQKEKKLILDPYTLQLVEERKSFAHYLFWFGLILFTSSILSAFIIYFFGDVLESQYAKSLKSENDALRVQIGKFAEKIGAFHKVMNKIASKDEELRVLVDLPGLDEGIRQAGIGGGDLSQQLVTGNVDVDKVLVSTNIALDQLDRQLKIQQESYNEILSQYKLNEKYFENFPAIKPVRGRFSSAFGMRLHPIYKIVRPHNGVDLTATRGTPVYATGNGTIEFTGGNPRTGFGRLIIIDHGFELKTYYAHLTNFKVKPGQKIKRGDVIGYSGSTGASVAPHLHYEVHYKGKPQDPSLYFLDDLDAVEFNIAIHGADKDRPTLD